MISALVAKIKGVEDIFDVGYYILPIIFMCAIAPLLIPVVRGIKAIINIIKEFISPLHPVTLESVTFDKRFSVHSDDQIEARYLVTPAFMDRLENLQATFGTKNLKCSFYRDRLLIAISTKRDLFEIGNLFVPINNPKQIDQFCTEINAITGIIDSLKLDQSTGL